MANYSYPIDTDWSVEDMTTVIDLWVGVEKAYDQGIDSQTLLALYKAFKTVVPSIGEEKRLGKEFEQVSGFSLYRTIKAAEANKIVRMK